MNYAVLRFPLFAVLCLLFYQTGAQPCEYKVFMHDEIGDGWDGGILTVTTGPTVQQLYLADDGMDSVVSLVVTTGMPVKLSWLTGDFDSEVSFSLRNNDGDILFEVTNPDAGQLYSDTAVCIACLKPLNVLIENVYDTRAKVRWSPAIGSVPPVGWRVIYDTTGFTPGPGKGDTIYTTLPKTTITGLQEKTFYDFYVQQDCGNGSGGDLAGPYTFETYRADDVGMTGVLTPQSGCDLGVETVTILMTNFGANPQSLIPFNYSVNGILGGVPQPQDGFYTGVLGKDSTTSIEFETMYDFSAPGEYLIAVWTEMEGDEYSANDTFYFRIVNRLLAPYQQNFETWNGGWYVDTVASDLPSWEFGTPNTPNIPAAASGVNAWVTNLDGNYNPGEESYLNSPCFDFTNLSEDPVIEFSLIYSTETAYDGGFLEMSTDDGDNWNRVGAIGEGLNWYNINNVNTALGNVWANKSNGWVTARHRLPGTAGQSSVRLRFGFGADALVQMEGMGVDDIHIFEPYTNDLAGLSAKTAGASLDCGLLSDTVTFRFINLGSEPQTLVSVNYALNGTAPVTENLGAVVVNPDQSFEYTFTTPFDSRDGLFEIKCWTTLAGELNPANDTTTITVDHLPAPVPVHEDFETGFPAGWLSNATVTSGHNNTSQVLSLRMNNIVQTFNTELPRVGFVSPGDSLSFDYRIVNFAGAGGVATQLTGGTKFDVLISTNCGKDYQTLYTIDSATHTPKVPLQTVSVDLSQFAGLSVLIRFNGNRKAGDFYFDLDNINLRACAADMDLDAVTIPADPGQNNGSATVNVGLGNPPYRYLWNTGDTTQTITGLGMGNFTVTVTDDLGCSGTLSVHIGNSPTTELNGLTRFAIQPNPTAGTSVLSVEFDQAADLQVQVLDLTGRLLWNSDPVHADRFSAPLDLSSYPGGLYLVRLLVDGRSVVRKLVKRD